MILITLSSVIAALEVITSAGDQPVKKVHGLTDFMGTTSLFQKNQMYNEHIISISSSFYQN